MPSVTVYTSTEDGFINNISGVYPTETFVLASSTSSSNANECQAFWFFNTSNASTGIPASATITQAKFRAYCYSYDDINGVAGWGMYSDPNAVLGSTLTVGDFDDSSFGLQLETSVSAFTAGAWYELNLACTINRAGYTNMKIQPQLADMGPANAYFYAREHGSNYGELVLTYALPPSGGTLPMMGVG